jgi:hypothetical protein
MKKVKDIFEVVGSLILIGFFVSFMVWGIREMFFTDKPEPITSSSSTVGETESIDEYTVYAAGTSAVEQYLRSPSTAEFDRKPDTRVWRIDEDSYAVVGHVNSQNGFGAMVRSQYGVEMTFVGDSIIVDKVIINGEKYK